MGDLSAIPHSTMDGGDGARRNRQLGLIAPTDVLRRAVGGEMAHLQEASWLGAQQSAYIGGRTVSAGGSNGLWQVWLALAIAAVLGASLYVEQRLVGRWAQLKRRIDKLPASAHQARKVITPSSEIEAPATRFKDVAGVAEVIDELSQLTRYLREPEPYLAAGADLPRGYLLVGPPGTGKTLLARAVAGESGVPFFAAAATEFVETYVGVGAARVRKLFAQAHAASPSIVFIDELDAIGRQRAAHGASTNEERDATLNQLLVEMDGFVQSSVVVLAATNRPDVLDAALLRPGRFDRQISVPAPDRLGRSEILALHLRRRKSSAELDLDGLGRRTAGFTGADLANLVNMAAHIALRQEATEIGPDHFEEALATVMLGPVRKSAAMAARDRTIAAWHEAGHALLGLWLSEAADPLHVTILPRATTGGATWFPPLDDVFLSRRQAEAQLIVAMGGRVAEEIYLDDDYTQGASQDFKVAAGLAEHMVTEFGMSSLGPGYIEPQAARFGYLAEQVHAAQRELLETALARARALLVPSRPILERVVVSLLEEESLDTAALVRLAGGAGPSFRPHGVCAVPAGPVVQPARTTRFS